MDILQLLPQGYGFWFFLTAFLAGLGYAVQGLLVAQYGRRFDPFLVTACRGLSFAFTLSPLLLLAPKGSIAQTLPYLPQLAVAGFLGALAVALIFFSQCYFPVGIVASFQQMSQLWLLYFGFVFLGEQIGALALAAILILLVGVVALALQKSGGMTHLKLPKKIHYLWVMLFPLFLGSAFYLLASVSLKANALVAGYLWEVFIGIFAVIIFWLRKLFFTPAKRALKGAAFHAKDALLIGLVASGTLFGTGGQVILYTLGSPGIAQMAVTSLQMLLMAVIGAAFFGERLKAGQWLAIAVIVSGLVGLKLATG